MYNTISTMILLHVEYTSCVLILMLFYLLQFMGFFRNKFQRFTIVLLLNFLNTQLLLIDSIKRIKERRC